MGSYAACCPTLWPMNPSTSLFGPSAYVRKLAIPVLVSSTAMACSGSVTAPSVSCSTGALRGSYGVQRNGQTAPGTLLTTVGLATFDGLGHVLEQMTVSNSGAISTIAN